MRALLVIPMLIGLLWPVVVLADITGKPRIIDGDTLEIAGERIRLHGIDAPESGQTCVADGKRWHCGVEASSALAFKIARGWVTCQGEDRDRYGRVIAVCNAGGVGGPELNAWLALAAIRREARAPTLCESVPREFPGGRPQPDPWSVASRSVDRAAASSGLQPSSRRTAIRPPQRRSTYVRSKCCRY